LRRALVVASYRRSNFNFCYELASTVGRSNREGGNAGIFTAVRANAIEPRSSSYGISALALGRCLVRAGVLKHFSQVADVDHMAAGGAFEEVLMLFHLIVTTARHRWWRCSVCPADHGPATPDAAVCCRRPRRRNALARALGGGIGPALLLYEEVVSATAN
jgi:hypothetical protein